MSDELTDDSALISAMSEYRDRGRRAFLEDYGSREPTQFVVVRDGRRYDAAALLEAAKRYQSLWTGISVRASETTPPVGDDAFGAIGLEVHDLRTWSRDDEARWRLQAWEEIDDQPVAPDLLRELGVYGGAQGVWVDKNRTSILAPTGVAVGVLHTGRHYADDLAEDGIVYHYPRTRRPSSRDASEIEAVKNAGRFDLPIFVISETGPGGRNRLVRRGWVDGWDDTAAVFLISFLSADAVPAIADIDTVPFAPRVGRRRTAMEVTRLERDPRFKFQTLRRFDGRCVLSHVDVLQMLDGAHIIPVDEGGPDDERNGLLLAAGLHRAFDADLWAVDPDTLQIVTRPQGPEQERMGIVVTDLTGLAHPPHREALEWRYRRFLRNNDLP